MWTTEDDQEDRSLLLNLFFAQIVAQALIATAIYNLFFHKLAKFPGPFLARSSLVSIPLSSPV